MADIYLAFRFHVNFYHSYRGDSLDEKGIGKDIRIIRSLLDDLDILNAEGIDVCGTWDIENYYSLEYMMREHAPDLIERIQARVAAGTDEVELMSYNNGIVSACTVEEFRRQHEWSVSNPNGSGFDNLFESWEPIVRPQECMYTPSFLRLYPEAGVPTISIYNSGIPFNGFSTLVPPLGFVESYNPLTLKADGIDGTMTLLPAYNHGDIAEHWGTLRGWLKSMHRRQQRHAADTDLLLLIDMDADDEFWVGEYIPGLSRLIPSFDGFSRLVHSVANLPWLKLTKPGDYLRAHAPVGEITLNQDTADGSFDGLSSWAEKWSNTQLWMKVQRSRDLADFARQLGADELPEARAHLDEALHARLLTQSTTHFGMASPVMNKDRLQDGFRWGDRAMEEAAAALELVKKAKKGGNNLLFPSDVAGDRVGRPGVPVRIHGQSDPPIPKDCTILPWAVLDPGDRVIIPSPTSGAVRITDGALVNELGRVTLDRSRGFTVDPLGFVLRLPGVTYDKRERRGMAAVPNIDLDPKGRFGTLSAGGDFPLADSQGPRVTWSMALTLFADSPNVLAEVTVSYPETEHKGYFKGRATRLNRTWDHRWTEIKPAEIVSPSVGRDSDYRVFKRNFFGDESAYDLDYHRFNANRELDSINNHITNGWVGIGDGQRGLVIAQSTAYDNNFAFCPMRLRELRGKGHQLYLNPFGTYYGKQWKHPPGVSGIGQLAAILTADQLASYAPSFPGKRSTFAILLLPFDGAEPPAEVKADAALFAANPLVV